MISQQDEIIETLNVSILQKNSMIKKKVKK